MAKIRTIQTPFRRQEDLFYLASPKNVDRFLSSIQTYFSKKVYNSHTPISSTIYLNNDEHEVPWWLSLKLRRYLQTYSKVPKFYQNKKYFFDIKDSHWSDRGQRLKKRFESKGNEALKLVNSVFFGNGFNCSLKNDKTEIGVYNFPITKPLRPYLAIEYRRQNYFTPNGRIKMTLDHDVTYYFFPNDGKAIYLGKEKGLRVEMKCDIDYTSSVEYAAVKEIINSCDAVPIISKKYNAYNLIARHIVRSKGQKLVNELSNHEVEAKLIVKKEKMACLVVSLKDKFRNGFIPGFQLSKRFPFTLETGNLAKYFLRASQPEREIYKIMYKGKWFQIVTKERQVIIKTLFKYPILERRENKGQGYLLISKIKPSSLICQMSSLKGKILSVNDFFRARKAFWITNIETDRRYHVSIDYCVAPGDILSELEVEYSGTPNLIDGSKRARKLIIDDIKFLVENIIKAYPRGTFTPTTLTKYQWISKLS